MVTQNTNIAASDYNTIQAQVASILGTGSATRGYGQSVTSGQVTTGSTITAAQWANLKLDIIKCATHQGTTSNANITPLSNLTITNNPATTIYAADVNKFSAAATVIDTNRFAITSGQFTSSPILSSTRTSQWGSPTKTTVTHSFYIQWSSVNAARYFWNSGGTVNLTASRASGSGTNQNNDWTSILNGMGTVIFDMTGVHATSGTGTTKTWYDLTTADQPVFTKAGNAGTYAGNDYTVLARKDAGNTTLYVTINFNDDAKVSYSGYDYVDGTLTSNVGVTYASGQTSTTVAFDTGTWTYANSVLLSQ
jgi:hypothetical protein